MINLKKQNARPTQRRNLPGRCSTKTSSRQKASAAISDGRTETISTFYKGAMPKAEATFTLVNGARVKVSGVTGPARQRFVIIRQDCSVAVTLFRFFHGSGVEASKSVADQGVVTVKDWGKVRDAVASLKLWPSWPVITTPGWHDGAFALPSGRILVPEGISKPLKAYRASSNILSRGGRSKAWRAQVAKPMGDHLFASFWMMLPFAAALLRDTDRIDNIGFELSGRGGIGKSTILALVSSCCGLSVGGDGLTYWRTLNTTKNALEATMAEFNDMLVLLDEAGSMQGAAKTQDRAYELHNLIFRLALGTIRGRMGEAATAPSRFIYAISTNRSLPSLLGPTHAAEAEALTDRLINVPLLDEREFGAFDHLPAGFKTMAEFVGTVKRGAADHYGHAIIRYLKFLVRNHASDSERIRRFVAKTVAEFITLSGADPNDGSQKRVAEAFGIVAAGGLLAQKAKILTKNYRPMEAALDCYGLHRDHGRMTRTFDDRLTSLIRHPKTIDLDSEDAKTLTKEMLRECRCYLKTGRSGDRHLLVPKAYRDRLLPGWNLIRHDSDVEERHVKHKQRNAKVELIALGVKMTVYRFDISELED